MNIPRSVNRALRTGLAASLAVLPFAQTQSNHVPSEHTMVRAWNQDDLAQLASAVGSRLTYEPHGSDRIAVHEFTLKGPLPGYGVGIGAWNPETRIELTHRTGPTGESIECRIGTEESGISYHFPIGEGSIPTVRFHLPEDPFGGGSYTGRAPLGQGYAQEATLCLDEALRSLLTQRRAER